MSAAPALLPTLRAVLPQLLKMGALTLAYALTEGFGLLLLVPLLGLLTQTEGQADGAAWLDWLGLTPALEPMLGLFVVLVLVRGLLGMARDLAGLQLEATLVDGLRQRAWRALLHCNWRSLAGMRQSDTSSLLISTIDRVGNGISQLIGLAASAATLAAVTLAALAISPAVALVAMLGGGLVLLAYRGTRRQAGVLGRALGETYGTLHRTLGEGLGALRIIKSFGRETRSAADLARNLAALRQSQRRYLYSAGLARLALQGSGALLLALLVWLAINRWQLGAAAILPVVALFARGVPLLGAVQESWQNWAHTRPALDQTFAMIARAEADHEADCAEVPVPQLRQQLEVDSVSVHYAQRPDAALDRLSLTLPAGSITLITGRSGSGKSTLADLLGGLIAPDSGSLAIDGVTLDAVQRRAWRSAVAYVQQEPLLFHASLRENLLWAEPAADEARLHAALIAASASFVFDLPQGFETMVGDRGTQLSGGERQRIVLARALLRDPALLILDEATSALDAASETAVAQAIAALRGCMTIVIISHRGGLAELADRIATLESGRIVAITGGQEAG